MTAPRIKARTKGDLDDREAALAAILMDRSGLDIAEFLWIDHSKKHNCYRARPYQWYWWRKRAKRSIDQGARSIGKSESINTRAHAFPFNFPQQEMVITAPENTHLVKIAERIILRITQSRLMREMLVRGRSGINQRPFKILFENGARIYGIIPHRDGLGLKGSHPTALHVDECLPAGTLVATKNGQVPIEEVRTGDMVLTHKHRWRKVLGTANRNRPTVLIEGMGHEGMVASENHPFLAVRPVKQNVYVRESNSLNRLRYAFTEPEWIPAKHLESSFWSSPAAWPKAAVPSLYRRGQHRRTAYAPCDPNTKEFMWVVGLWLAEGSFGSKMQKVVWSVHVDEAPEVTARMAAAGLSCWVSPVQSTAMCVNVHVASVVLADWLLRHFGKGAHHKHLPAWAMGMPAELRQSLLDGLMYGDGHRSTPNEFRLTTVSRKLAVDTRLLAITLGRFTSIYWCDTSQYDAHIRGQKINSAGFYNVAVRMKSDSAFTFMHNSYSPVHSVTSTGRVETLYDIEVEEDHSFVADGIICHNSQDLGDLAYKELPEIVDFDIEGAYVKLHGVSKGLRDDFYKKTQPGSGYEVTRITAMSREDWNAEERAHRVKEYGSDTAADFRRNIYGQHGNATNRLFQQYLLMKCQPRKDIEPNHPYHDEFASRKITADAVRALVKGDLAESSPEHIAAALGMLQLPESHLTTYRDNKALKATFWCGMDIGILDDPSEIIVFVEYLPSAAELKVDGKDIAKPPIGQTRIKLLTRINLDKIPVPIQHAIICAVIDHYRPRAFGLDGNGVGVPIFQMLQQEAGRDRFAVEADSVDDPSPIAVRAITTVKSYNFGAKIVVGIDEEKVDELQLTDPQDILKKAGIQRWTKDWATDVIREDWVHSGRLMFPDDDDILNDFMGQTWQGTKEPIDAYGKSRRAYGGIGGFHILDAIRNAALAWRQGRIEEFAKEAAVQEPVLVYFG